MCSEKMFETVGWGVAVRAAAGARASGVPRPQLQGRPARLGAGLGGRGGRPRSANEPPPIRGARRLGAAGGGAAADPGAAAASSSRARTGAAPVSPRARAGRPPAPRARPSAASASSRAHARRPALARATAAAGGAGASGGSASAGRGSSSWGRLIRRRSSAWLAAGHPGGGSRGLAPPPARSWSGLPGGRPGLSLSPLRSPLKRPPPSHAPPAPAPSSPPSAPTGRGGGAARASASTRYGRSSREAWPDAKSNRDVATRPTSASASACAAVVKAARLRSISPSSKSAPSEGRRRAAAP